MGDERELHRPSDPALLRQAATELRERGLSARDIAEALKLTEEAVRQLLSEPAGQVA